MGVLRVIVGSPYGGPRSSLWRIWAGKGTSDVYVAARPIAGEYKASLHQSGKWRIGLTEAHIRRSEGFVSPEQDRAMHKWQRPAEFAPGTTRAFMIEIPSSELRPMPRTNAKDVAWVPSPAHGQEVEIDVFLTRDHPAGTWVGRDAMQAQLLHRESLPSGEELVVTSIHRETSAERARQIELHKGALLETNREWLESLGSEHPPGLRGVLVTAPDPAKDPIDVPWSFIDLALTDQPRPPGGSTEAVRDPAQDDPA